MNERIEKLMDETDSWCDKNFPSDWLNRVDEFLPLWNEKFAELIVGECAELVRKYNYDCMRNDEPYGITSDDIMKHFGVKEIGRAHV